MRYDLSTIAIYAQKDCGVEVERVRSMNKNGNHQNNDV